MNKRDFLEAAAEGGVLVGLFGAIGVAKAQAGEPDLRDEILAAVSDIHTHYKFKSEGGGTELIRAYRWNDKLYVQHTDYTIKRTVDENGIEQGELIHLFDDVTEHKTIEEAYLYAKALKEKHYSGA